MDQQTETLCIYVEYTHRKKHKSQRDMTSQATIVRHGNINRASRSFTHFIGITNAPN